MAVVLIAGLPFVAAFGGSARADKPAAVTVEGAYPGLATGVLKLGRLTDMEKNTVLKAYPIEIKSDFAEEMLKEAPPEMRKELEKNFFFLLEQKAMEMLIRQDAVSMGISAEQSKDAMLKSYVERLTGGLTVNEAEVKTFKEGQEVFRHVGFFAEKDVLEQLARLGVK